MGPAARLVDGGETDQVGEPALVAHVDQHRPAAVAVQEAAELPGKAVAGVSGRARLDGAGGRQPEPHLRPAARRQDAVLQRRRSLAQQAREPGRAGQHLLPAGRAERLPPLVGEDHEAQALAQDQRRERDQHELAGEAGGPGPPQGSATSAAKL
jgi:hypothetical protein